MKKLTQKDKVVVQALCLEKVAGGIELAIKYSTIFTEDLSSLNLRLTDIISRMKIYK